MAGCGGGSSSDPSSPAPAPSSSAVRDVVAAASLIAAKYKGKADGQEKAVKNMTSGPKVKLDDGTEEDHKVIDTKDPAALKNLADWILAQ